MALTPSEAAQRRWSDAREKETDALTPLQKTRAALEKKAGAGDVYAARELRENAEHYYGQALSQGGLAVLTEEQLRALDRWVREGVARQG